MSGRETGKDGPAAFLAGHPALFLAVGSLLISLLGPSFEWTLFRQFGVNFFYSTEVAVFLMGAFREPVTFLLSATALVVGWLLHFRANAERAWLARKPRRGPLLERYRAHANSRLNPLAPALFFVGYSVMFICIHAGNRAGGLRGGDRPDDRRAGAPTPAAAGNEQPVRALLQGQQRRDCHRPPRECRLDQRRCGRAAA